MIELIVILTVLIALRMVLYRDLFSPASVFCLTITTHSLIFYCVSYFRYFPKMLRHWWQVRHNYQDVGHWVLLFYLFWALVCLLIQMHTNKNDKRVNVSSNGRMSSLDMVLMKYMKSGVMFYVIIFVDFIFLVHLLSINITKVLYNRGEYLSIRDPLVVGIYDTFLGVIHIALPLLGVLMAIPAVFYLRTRDLLFSTFALGGFLYCFFFSSSCFSRFSVAQLFIFALMLHLTKKKKVDFSALAAGVIGFLTFGIVSGLRLATPGAYGNFGTSAIIDAVTTGAMFYEEIMFFFFFSFFSGGFVLAAALQGDFFYPLKYKLLAFSPLPSFIDGFNSVEYVVKANRPSPHAAFSNFAEAYLFGPGFLVFFCAFMAYLIYRTTRFWKDYAGGYSIVLMAPMYYGFFRMHIYALRSPMRMFLMTLLLCVVFDRICSGWERRVERRKVAGLVPGMAP